MLLCDTNVLLKRPVNDLGAWETEFNYFVLQMRNVLVGCPPPPFFIYFFFFDGTWMHAIINLLFMSPEKQRFPCKKSINNTLILKFILNARFLPQKNLKTTIKQTTADRVKFLERKAPSPAINALIFALNCLRFRFPFSFFF